MKICFEASSPGSSVTPEIPNDWIRIQDFLKSKLVTEDDFTWKLPSTKHKQRGGGRGGGGEEEESCRVLKYVGGVDLSFSKEDPFVACGTLVILDFKTLEVIYEDSSVVRLNVPYVPGFLAFREAPVLLELLEKMESCSHPLYPQLLMVDGNGILHPRGFGLACHLGVLANLPAIGIGKNLHHVDGLTQSRVRELLQIEGNLSDDIIPLAGDSGCTLGAALRSTQDSLKPIFVSVGHRVSLATAVDIVKICCKYRIPEPIRQADIRSRDYIRKHQLVD